MTSRERISVRVERVCDEAERIRSYELVAANGGALPPFTAGAHIDVHLPSGLARSYSLASDPAETHRYLIAVQRETAGRGGSAEMHAAVKSGDVLAISAPVNNFRLAERADRHLLIAGGIGVTPIMSMIRALDRRGEAWTLHYCTRTPEQTAFRAALSVPEFAGRVRFHHDNGDPSKGLDVAALLSTPDAGTHVYCCGPAGLMSAVAARMTGWPNGALHLEYFSNSTAFDGPVGAFEVELASSGRVLQIPPDRSILDVLEENGVAVDSVCAEGICGTCIVEVLEGVPDHRDMAMDDDTHASNRWITVCCSRSQTKRLKLAL